MGSLGRKKGEQGELESKILAALEEINAGSLSDEQIRLIRKYYVQFVDKSQLRRLVLALRVSKKHFDAFVHRDRRTHPEYYSGTHRSQCRRRHLNEQKL